MSGELQAIWLKRHHRRPMDAVQAVAARAGSGLVGNANQGGRRQVTVISVEAWRESERALARTIDPALRRANLMVSGVDLEESRGRVLTIGPISIVVRGETKPCNRMEAACQGLRQALTPGWRGGAYGEVLTDGDIRVGDPVAWVASVNTA